MILQLPYSTSWVHMHAYFIIALPNWHTTNNLFQQTTDTLFIIRKYSLMVLISAWAWGKLQPSKVNEMLSMDSSRVALPPISICTWRHRLDHYYPQMSVLQETQYLVFCVHSPLKINPISFSVALLVGTCPLPDRISATPVTYWGPQGASFNIKVSGWCCHSTKWTYLELDQRKAH